MDGGGFDEKLSGADKIEINEKRSSQSIWRLFTGQFWPHISVDMVGSKNASKMKVLRLRVKKRTEKTS